MWPFSRRNAKLNYEVIEMCRELERRLEAAPGRTLREKLDASLRDERLRKKAHWLVTIRNKCAHDAGYYVSDEAGLIDGLREAYRELRAALPGAKRGCLGWLLGR